MTSAGVGVAVHLDGFTAAGLAAHRAVAAAGPDAAVEIAMVFAGTRHDDDEYSGVLSAVRRTIPNAVILGCSATGVLTGAEEVENATAVAVLVLGGQPLPTPIYLPGVRGDPRVAGARLGREVLRVLGGKAVGAAVAVLVDPAELDAADFVAGIADVAPDLLITGAGASGGESGCRVFWKDAAQADACVALVFQPELHPSMGMTQGCQAVGDPQTITAAEGNLILEIDGRPAVEALEKTLSNPNNPGLRQMTKHLLAGISELGAGGRSDYVVRPFAIADSDRPALAVAEPVRAGQTICFTVRDAIGAREDMKAMLDEQAVARDTSTPRFGFYFNCAGRGSALYGQAGLDPELIQRRFGALPVAGIESSFEIAPTCGRPRIHMFTGVLLLAG